MTFLTPLGALVGLVCVVPIIGIALGERRERRFRAALGLADPRPRVHAPVVLGWVVAFGLLAAGAAQPIVRVHSTVGERTDAQAYVFFDITRSMTARRAPDGPTRLERAVAASIELRSKLRDVPVGIGSVTNRALPYLFPTVGEYMFARVAERAIAVNQPAAMKSELFSGSTDFQSLEAIASDNFFSPSSRKRLVLFFTDGESGAFAVGHLVRAFARHGVDLIAVRFWNRRERIWNADGTVDPYRPDPLSSAQLDYLAALTTGGRVYGETEIPAAVAAARAYLGPGSVVAVETPGHVRPLAPWAVLAACIPLAVLVLPGLALPFVRRRSRRASLVRVRIAYSMLASWRGSAPTRQSRSRGAPAPLPPSSSVPRSSTGAWSPGGD